MQPTQKSYKKVGLTVGLLLILGIAAVAMVNKSAQEEVGAPVDETPSEATSTPSTPTTFKDGTYSATGSYVSPAGPETILVNLTLAGGVVTDATVAPQATNPISVQMQGKFSTGYKALVVGKKIDEINLTKVSGSSLTPKGFNDALEQIKDEATNS